MSQEDRDYELSLAALRGEEPPGVDKDRLRARLIQRGVALTALGSAAPARAAANATFGLANKIVLAVVVTAGLTLAVVGGTAPRAARPLEVAEPSGSPDARPAPVSFQPASRPEQAPASPRGVRASVAERSPALDLARETALLSAAAAALNASDPRSAARLLSQHEREFPTGFLRAEREKARTKLARIGAGHPP